MPVQKLIEMKRYGNVKDNVSVMIAMHCAALIKNVKAANIITVSRKEYYYVKAMLKGTSIKSFLLKLKGDKYILYLYRLEKIENYLRKESVCNFLKKYGYFTDNIEEMLAILSNRISLYSNGEIEFPHEIGIFLEYPLLDVKGFLENEGKNFIFTGYWKVYHNEVKTKELFKCFDEKREEAVTEILLGKSIREIAV